MVSVRKHTRRIDGKTVPVRKHNRKLSKAQKFMLEENKALFDFDTDVMAKKKAKKINAFKLPIETAVYVPSTNSRQTKISQIELNKRVRDVKSFLGRIYGGFSAVKVEGGYYLHSNNTIVEEEAIRVCAFSTTEAFEQNKDKLLNFLKKIQVDYGQESIGYEIEGNMYYIS